jgi:hypothetical protein
MDIEKSKFYELLKNHITGTICDINTYWFRVDSVNRSNKFDMYKKAITLHKYETIEDFDNEILNQLRIHAIDVVSENEDVISTALSKFSSLDTYKDTDNLQNIFVYYNKDIEIPNNGMKFCKLDALMQSETLFIINNSDRIFNLAKNNDRYGLFIYPENIRNVSTNYRIVNVFY